MIGNAPGPGSTVGSFGAQINSSYQEELYAVGKSFSYEDYLTFGSTEVKHILFDPSAYTGENITFNPLLFGATGGPFTIDLYSGSSADADGTPLIGSNRRYEFPAPKSTLMEGGSNWSPGTRFSGDAVLSNTLNPVNSNPGSNLGGLPFELNPALKYGLLIASLDGDGLLFQIKMTWFEL